MGLFRRHYRRTLFLLELVPDFHSLNPLVVMCPQNSTFVYSHLTLSVNSLKISRKLGSNTQWRKFPIFQFKSIKEQNDLVLKPNNTIIRSE